MPDAPDLKQQLSDLAVGLSSVSTELQEISRGIHPAIVSEGGVGPALKSLGRRSAVPVTLNLGIERRLPDAVRIRNRYVDRLLTAAESDIVVAEQFSKVSGLIDPPTRLLHPAALYRVATVRRRHRSHAGPEHQESLTPS